MYQEGYTPLSSGDGGQGGRCSPLKSLVCLLLTLCPLCALVPGSWREGFEVMSGWLGVPPPIAVTSCGPVHGLWEVAEGVPIAAFRGIKFGTTARWLPASLTCPATQVAVTDGPACFQHDPNQYHAGQSEDCLYLNLFAPACAARGSCAALPVIVFLHGGGLQGGDASGYSGVQNLVALSENTILVVCQYRLGVLGFMATPELSERDPRGVSGNYGFLDQQLCLRWVREHIASFRGDPKSITLLGHSAGATTINAHLAAPGSVDLFHRAILLSGSPGTPKLSQAEKELQDTSLWLPAAGCSGSDSLLCLLNLEPGFLSDSLPERYRLRSESSNVDLCCCYRCYLLCLS